MTYVSFSFVLFFYFIRLLESRQTKTTRPLSTICISYHEFSCRQISFEIHTTFNYSLRNYSPKSPSSGPAIEIAISSLNAKAINLKTKWPVQVICSPYDADTRLNEKIQQILGQS
jgi:hypothetical protein